MMPQYADFMYQIGMLDESQRDYFQKYALQAVTYIKQKNFKAAFEVTLRYENMPMQFTLVFILVSKNLKVFDIFLIFAQNIDCEYTLEPPWGDGSNEYPQSIFWSKKKRKIGIPLQTPVFLYKSGV